MHRQVLELLRDPFSADRLRTRPPKRYPPTPRRSYAARDHCTWRPRATPPLRSRWAVRTSTRGQTIPARLTRHPDPGPWSGPDGSPPIAPAIFTTACAHVADAPRLYYSCPDPAYQVQEYIHGTPLHELAPRGRAVSDHVPGDLARLFAQLRRIPRTALPILPVVSTMTRTGSRNGYGPPHETPTTTGARRTADCHGGWEFRTTRSRHSMTPGKF